MGAKRTTKKTRQAEAAAVAAVDWSKAPAAMLRKKLTGAVLEAAARKAHRNCETDPCQLCQKRSTGKPCGDCRAGVVLSKAQLANGNTVTVVETCAVCAPFDDSDPIYPDAVGVVEALLDMLDVECFSGDGSVADAMERVLDLVKGASAVRENLEQGDISDDPVAQAICGVGPGPVDPPALDGLKAALTEKLELPFRCGCEKPCATLEQHECAIRRALGMHRGNCEGCAQRERAVRP